MNQTPNTLDNSGAAEPGRPASRLPLLDRVRLMEHMKAGYTASGLNDADYARQASDDLKLTISPYQVRYLREMLRIPNNLIVRVARDEPNQQADMLTAEAIEQLRATVAELSATVSSLAARVAKLERFEFCERPSHGVPLAFLTAETA